MLLGTAQRCPVGFAVRVSRLTDLEAASTAEAFARAMNAAIEAVVATDIAQYQWEYKRFKRPPSGVTDPYRNP
jgi:KDO2-lipid IV(A) lauroyltransferase